VESIEFDVEVDIKPSEAETLSSGYQWEGKGEFDGIDIAIHPPKGHGFGLTELLTISVAVATSVTTDLLADAIKEAIRGTVRRVRVRKTAKDGESQIEGDQADFDLKSTTLAAAVEEALADADSASQEHDRDGS
jgi:hypothetical protein